MKSYTKLQCFLAVFLLCFVNLGYNAQTLGLYEGDICQKGNGQTADHICRTIESCPVVIERLKKKINPKICSFTHNTSIVCCPTENNAQIKITTTTKKPNNIPVLKTYSATEMCKQYSELIYLKRRSPISTTESEDEYVIYKDCYDATTLIVNGEAAEPKEFPHMALLGYSEKPDNDSWGCGGSLISNRFVLTAAHCEKIKKNYGLRFATWARLGELDYSTETDDARPSDYKIEKRIIHENYTSSSKYHDIALFRLEKDVVFSAYVRPICLNTDTTLRTPVVIATGWGQTAFYSPGSPRLLKVWINTIPAKECDKSFLHVSNRTIELAQGIVDNLMVCAGKSKSANATCGGDSGGPIQIKHESFKCMYLQVGITSFGGPYCGRLLPSIFTRVSNYIPWIEKIVWPKM